VRRDLRVRRGRNKRRATGSASAVSVKGCVAVKVYRTGTCVSPARCRQSETFTLPFAAPHVEDLSQSTIRVLSAGPQPLPNYIKHGSAGPRSSNSDHTGGNVSPPSAACKLTLTVAISRLLEITCVHSSTLRQADDTMVVACDAPACLSCGKGCASTTGPDKFRPRTGLTGDDATRWNPPYAARLISTPGTFKCPLRRTCLPITA
jgi:hypothetical protein